MQRNMSTIELNSVIAIYFFILLLFTENSCGRTFSGMPDGSLTTPNYPAYYPNNMNCVYFIEVGGDFLTTITFKYFYLENRDDYLYIGIGTNTQPSKALYTYTGYEDPFAVEVSGDLIWFRIISDSSVGSYGASIVWHTEGNSNNQYEKNLRNIPFVQFGKIKN